MKAIVLFLLNVGVLLLAVKGQQSCVEFHDKKLAQCGRLTGHTPDTLAFVLSHGQSGSISKGQSIETFRSQYCSDTKIDLFRNCYILAADDLAESDACQNLSIDKLMAEIDDKITEYKLTCFAEVGQWSKWSITPLSSSVYKSRTCETLPQTGTELKLCIGDSDKTNYDYEPDEDIAGIVENQDAALIHGCSVTCGVGIRRVVLKNNRIRTEVCDTFIHCIDVQAMTESDVALSSLAVFILATLCVGCVLYQICKEANLMKVKNERKVVAKSSDSNSMDDHFQFKEIVEEYSEEIDDRSKKRRKKRRKS